MRMFRFRKQDKSLDTRQLTIPRRDRLLIFEIIDRTVPLKIKPAPTS